MKVDVQISSGTRSAGSSMQIASIDRMLGISADEVIEILPLDDDLREAAFGTRTAMGRLVHRVIGYEAGRLDDVTGFPAPQQLQAASARAIAWALHASHALDGPS